MIKANIGDKKLNHGYTSVYMPHYPGASPHGWVMEHRIVAEKAMGKPLKPYHIVHHIDSDRSNNSRNNLLICENMAYHSLIHKRARALKACGNSNYQKCTLCGKYDKIENLNKHFYHTPCLEIINKNQRDNRKARHRLATTED